MIITSYVMVEYRRRKYLGHIYRYPKERIVKRILGTTWNVGAKHKRGPKVTWMSMTKKDLLLTGLDLRDHKNKWRVDLTQLFAGKPLD